MGAKIRSYLAHWTVYVPVLAVAALVVTWDHDLPPPLVALVALFLTGAVLAAVHHAEVVAHKVGEPFGSLVLAVAVTVIEVALIVTLMISDGEKTQSLARDTVPGRGVVRLLGGRQGASRSIRRILVFRRESIGFSPRVQRGQLSIMF
jgi:Ca2+:H+ antiporter